MSAFLTVKNLGKDCCSLDKHTVTSFSEFHLFICRSCENYELASVQCNDLNLKKKIVTLYQGSPNFLTCGPHMTLLNTLWAR
jgi:hypothetical protein